MAQVKTSNTMHDLLTSHSGLALAVGGTGLAQIDFTNLNISLDKVAYILSIIASIYGMYLNKKKGGKQNDGL